LQTPAKQGGTREIIFPLAISGNRILFPPASPFESACQVSKGWEFILQGTLPFE